MHNLFCCSVEDDMARDSYEFHSAIFSFTSFWLCESNLYASSWICPIRR
uniref:Uncharacterized protein n=1 Tax=Rhizophora mucronata TaxID=61149 RepID=A0A2P2J4E4_RHIMU